MGIKNLDEINSGNLKRIDQYLFLFVQHIDKSALTIGSFGV
jgi:hypothetical protein